MNPLKLTALYFQGIGFAVTYYDEVTHEEALLRYMKINAKPQLNITQYMLKV